MRNPCLRTVNWLKSACALRYNRLVNFANKRKAACCALFALIGCYAASALGAIYSIGAAALLLSVCIIYCLCRHRIALMLPMLVCLLLFTGLYEIRDIRPDNLPTGKSTVIGTVSDDPSIQTNKGRQVLVLKDCKVNGEKTDYKIRLNIYDTESTFECGDRIKVSSANLNIPDGVTNPDGFDYNAYLWRQGIALTASGQIKNISIISEGSGLRTALYRVRNKLSIICDSIFGESSDIMRAVLLGDKSTLSESTREDFNKAGISHILAVSGLHVSAIALLISFILGKLRLPKAVNYSCSVVLLVLYALMTGASVSTMRAVIMFAILCATRFLGYPTDTLTRLSLSLLLQLTLNPLLVHDNSFILSYGCVAAILCGTDLLEYGNKRTGIISKLLGPILSSASTSFIVQVTTFPILASLFYSVPLLSVPANMICVPLAILALYIGFVVLLVGCISVSAAYVMAYPVRLIWKTIRIVTEYISELGFASVVTRSWPVLLLTAYLVLALISSRYFVQSKSKRVIYFTVLICCALVFTLLPSDNIIGATVVFLDVGNADSAVINAEGYTYLIDCGRADSTSPDYLASRGANVKGIFITHADTDHCGGLPQVLSVYPDATVYLPVTWQYMDVHDETYAALNDADVVYLENGDEMSLAGNLYVDVLWPDKQLVPKDENDGSLILEMTYANTSMLFMADITDAYDAEACCDADILKVAHHGSKYATTNEMLEIVTPETAIVSVGVNSYGHPTEEALGRLRDSGADIYRTDKSGAVCIVIGNDGYTITETIKTGEAK